MSDFTPSKRDNWQPIETALKEWHAEAGEGWPVILLALPPFKRRGDENNRRVYEGRWNDVQGTWTSVNGFILLNKATRWMPLPEPPDP
jgi:hypothetical protein